MEKCHPIIGKEIYSGNFNGDPYTFIEEDRDSNEEYLIFIIHGIGQTAQKLKSKCEKIKNTIHLLYIIYTSQFSLFIITLSIVSFLTSFYS